MSIASIEQALRQDLPHHWLQTEAEVTDCTFVKTRWCTLTAPVSTSSSRTIRSALPTTWRGRPIRVSLARLCRLERGDKFLLR